MSQDGGVHGESGDGFSPLLVLRSVACSCPGRAVGPPALAVSLPFNKSSVVLCAISVTDAEDRESAAYA